MLHSEERVEGTTFGEYSHDVVDLRVLGNVYPSKRFSYSQPEPGVNCNTDVLLRNLKAKGWCFVRLPRLVQLDQQTEVPQLRSFFAQHDAQHKQHYAAPLGYGYSSLPERGKEGFRALSGDRLGKMELPSEYGAATQGWLVDFVRGMDQLALAFMTRFMAMPLFGMRPSEMAKEADLPVAYLRQEHFGMLDIVLYDTKESADDDVRMVVEHYDPGLFSISFFADCEGLQLKEPILDPSTGQPTGEERWIDGPVNTRPGQEDIGVLWLGDAAVKLSQGKLKAGIHRVVRSSSPSSPKRLTAWYEVCTTAQALELTLDDTFQQAGEVVLPNLPAEVGTLQVEKGQRHYDFLRNVERQFGIPIRKSMRPSDVFKSQAPSSAPTRNVITSKTNNRNASPKKSSAW